MSDEVVRRLDYQPPQMTIETHLGKWITVAWSGSSASGKTQIWVVRAQAAGQKLGEVRWHGPWRKYAFVPAAFTVFEEDCLRDIADFCQDQTIAHRHPDA